jgi:hypothetical protein
MIYEEDDIAFNNLTDNEFEELCLDLLIKLGFHSPVWRQGGADNGRDIEVKFSVINPLIPTYIEKWFIECKRYSSGINVKEIQSKIAWADAENPDHFVIITSSYLTNNTRTWLDKIISLGKPYKIHCIEGKELTKIIVNFKDIVTKYFGDEYSKLVRILRAAWQTEGLLPEPETLFFIYKNFEPKWLTIEDLVFLWCTSKVREDEIEKWCSDYSNNLFAENETFSFDYLLKYIWEKSDKGVQSIFQSEDFYCPPAALLYGKPLKIIKVSRPKRAFYIHLHDKELGILEVLMKADKNFPIKIQRFDVD